MRNQKRCERVSSVGVATLVVLVSSLTSCKSMGDGADRFPSEIHLACTPQVEAPSRILKQDADLALQTACEKAGGSFRASAQDCLCPGLSIFVYGTQRCENLRTKTLNSEIEKTCFSIQDATHPKSEICFAGKNLSDASVLIANELAGFLSLSSFPLQATTTTWVNNPADLELFFKSDIGGYAKDQLERPVEISLPHTGARGFFSAQVYYEPDLSLIPNLISRKQHSNRGSEARFQAPPSDLLSDNLVAALSDLSNQLKKGLRENPDTVYQAASKQGCAELCSYSRSWDFTSSRPGVFGEEKATGTVQWEKQLASGAVHLNRVIIRNSAGIVEGFVVLTPSDTVSLVLSYQYEFLGAKFQRSLMAFDRNGKSVWRENQDGPVPSPWKASGLQNGGVVTCESGFPWPGSDENTFDGIFRIGPVAEGSVFGWVNTEGQNRVHQWSGVAAQGLITPGVTSFSNEEHARAVARLVHSGSDSGEAIPVLPLGLSECTERPDLWERNIPSEVKVVNLSSVFSMDRAACAASPLGRNIQKSPFLWVVGAGNDGEPVDTLISHSCPSNLGPLSNLIVVASSPGHSGSIAGESSYGSEYADLAADGSPPDSSFGKPATSFAAPRVSSAAASLALRQPFLSPKELKLALLVSVDIPESWSGNLRPLEVRSGGSLNLQRAHKAAELLFDHPAWVTRASTPSDVSRMIGFFRSLYCDSSRSQSCLDRIETRMKLLIKNGVIQNEYCN